MKITCQSVVGGWQTLMMFANGTESLVGPVCNRCSDVWDWQRDNLFDVVDEYKLSAV